jgi:hypothetical protein
VILIMILLIKVKKLELCQMANYKNWLGAGVGI